MINLVKKISLSSIWLQSYSKISLELQGIRKLESDTQRVAIDDFGFVSVSIWKLRHATYCFEL